MGKPQIVSKDPMTIRTVVDVLETIQKKEGQLNFRAQRAYEYAQACAGPLKAKESEDLVLKLMGLEIPRFKESYARKIADVLPASLRQVKVVLQGYPLTISNENLEKIAKTVAEVLPKRK
ncbi:MAG: hypothetical protein HC945_00845 [Nitrosarchaeum sp.]|nr:hypothetical protein [Nitrosarchaeum sp.]